MGIIFYLSQLPGDLIRLPEVIGVDKVAHLVAYAMLAATFLFGVHPFSHGSNRKVFVFAVVLFCILYGIGDEYHQSFIPGRSVSVWDVVADGLGGLVAGSFWYKWSEAKG